MTRLRMLLAVLVGKFVMFLAKRFGWGGSTLPGRISRKIEPAILRHLSASCSMGTVIISGTNGKTTSANMVRHILETKRVRVVHNHAGANLISGVTSAFIENATIFGRSRGEIGILEVDEATVPAAVRELSPRVAVVTNVFRDQLDRYGEVGHTVELVCSGLKEMKEGATVFLNADDPLVASMGERLNARVNFYGIETLPPESYEIEQRPDVKNCPRCDHELRYDVVYYAHLGRYSCANCGFRRPEPEIFVERMGFDGINGTTMFVRGFDEEIEIRLSIPGLYNVYNALSAMCVASSVGVDPSTIAETLRRFSAAFGRMERFAANGRLVLMVLVKNPTGFNEVIRTLMAEPGAKRILMAINDNYADGTDISWLWDVDFERLVSSGHVENVHASGLRAEDMALRLKYAGLDPASISVARDIRRAFLDALEGVVPGDTLYVLTTYTALLEMRKTVHKMGFAGDFWLKRSDGET